MNERQIKWASQHDWYVSNDGNEITVREVCRRPNGSTIETLKRFSTFADLREWAGY